MDSYRAMYLLLFRAASDAIAAIRAGEAGRGVLLLSTAQWEAEALYLEGAQSPEEAQSAVPNA